MLTAWTAAAHASRLAYVRPPARAGPSTVVEAEAPRLGACELQVAASRQRLQALLADCAHELADARTAGDAREAAYLREQTARGQRLQKSVAATEASRCVADYGFTSVAAVCCAVF